MIKSRPNWSTPRPITIPQVMTLKTLADVRKLLGHIPKERRQLSTWQHVEATLPRQLTEGAAVLPPATDIALQRTKRRFGPRSYGDGGKGLAPLSLCENRMR